MGAQIFKMSVYGIEIMAKSELKTANKERSPRAIIVRSKNEAIDVLKSMISVYDLRTLCKIREETKNFTLKYSGTEPQNKDDVKGTIKIAKDGVKESYTFYLTPVGNDLKGVANVLASYIDVWEKRQLLTKKETGLMSWEQWQVSKTGREAIANAELIFNSKLSIEQKKMLYKRYQDTNKK